MLSRRCRLADTPGSSSSPCHVLAVGCEGEAPDLVVDLKTDWAPLSEFVRVRTDLLSDRGGVLATREARATYGADYLEGVRVAELLDLSAGSHRIRVTLLARDGTVLMDQERRVDLERSQVVTVLMNRSCVDVRCPEDQTCQGGRCVDVTCSPEIPDSCPPPSCTSDAECAPEVSCAVGRCRDGECFAEDDGACGAGRWCHPEEGCRALDLPDAGPEEPDAGPPDAGPGCTPRTCAELGYDCGAPLECGETLDCGSCTAPDTCGGGGAPFRCGHGDTTPPTVRITSAPDVVTRALTAGFAFTGDDGTGTGVAGFDCRLDGGGWAACTSPHSPGIAGEGMHRFEVRARDVAGNVGAPDTHDWTIDRTPPSCTIDPIVDPEPSSYDATATVSFTFSCADALTAVLPTTVGCEVDGAGAAVSCGATSGSVDVGYSGPYVFGDHTLAISVRDQAGNDGSATRGFTVTRCAGDMQFPNRTSNGLARGACCGGLVVASWQEFTGMWHPRGDGSCRPASDFESRHFESIWGGGSCVGGRQTTRALLQDMGLPGCSSAAGRTTCVEDQTEAREHCGTDADSDSGQTPHHGRANEGWHGDVADGCERGTMSTSLLMRRYGSDGVCFDTVDRATERGSVRSTDLCHPEPMRGLSRYCRTNPVDSAVACVCHTSDPYADDGRN